MISDTDRVRVEGCTFAHIEEIGLGFWRNVSQASVVGCTFEDCRQASYFGRSVDHLTYETCTFHADDGVAGAPLADSEDDQPDTEAPSPGWALAITVRRCTFRSRGAPGTGNAVLLYDVEDATVERCRFEAFSALPVALGLEDRSLPLNVTLRALRVAWAPDPGDGWLLRPAVILQTDAAEPSSINLQIHDLCAQLPGPPPSVDDLYRVIIAAHGPLLPPDLDVSAAADAFWAALGVSHTQVRGCWEGDWQVWTHSVVFEATSPQHREPLASSPDCVCD